jgi:hypothetical protein
MSSIRELQALSMSQALPHLEEREGLIGMRGIDKEHFGRDLRFQRQQHEPPVQRLVDSQIEPLIGLLVHNRITTRWRAQHMPMVRSPSADHSDQKENGRE